MASKKRPRVRVRFKYNMDTGEIEEFIIDDNAPGASENYHDGVAEIIASRLSRNPEFEDAGPDPFSDGKVRTEPGPREKGKEPDGLDKKKIEG